MKRFLTLVAVIVMLPVFADEINMTPQSTFSGYQSTPIHTKYPKLKTYNAPDRSQIMKARSVKDFTYTQQDNSQMNPFQQRIDSSDMMHMQGIQNGIQNMYMDF